MLIGLETRFSSHGPESSPPRLPLPKSQAWKAGGWMEMHASLSAYLSVATP